MTDKVKAATFTKEQLLQSKKYAGQSDLLNALLKDNQQYTVKQADKLINDFLKGKVN